MPGRGDRRDVIRPAARARGAGSRCAGRSGLRATAGSTDLGPGRETDAEGTTNAALGSRRRRWGRVGDEDQRVVARDSVRRRARKEGCVDVAAPSAPVAVRRKGVEASGSAAAASASQRLPERCGRTVKAASSAASCPISRAHERAAGSPSVRCTAASTLRVSSACVGAYEPPVPMSPALPLVLPTPPSPGPVVVPPPPTAVGSSTERVRTVGAPRPDSNSPRWHWASRRLRVRPG